MAQHNLRTTDHLPILWILALGIYGCPKCPEPTDREVVGYVTGPSLRGTATVPAEGATVEVGDDAILETVLCYGGNVLLPKTGRVPPTNEFRVQALLEDEGVSDLTGVKTRVMFECAHNVAAPRLVRASWFNPVTLVNVGEIAVSVDGTFDTGLIEGKGLLCIYNTSNVPMVATVEVFFPDLQCVDVAPANPERNLTQTRPRTNACAPNPPANHLKLCSKEGEVPAEHVYCEVCGGTTTTRITRYYFGYCGEDAKEDAMRQAANCVIEDGPCG